MFQVGLQGFRAVPLSNYRTNEGTYLRYFEPFMAAFCKSAFLQTLPE